ncbi:hypothetical protein [Oceanobacillus jeddahense]|uniref:Uncharacterized protein n=1 Tax=Oceanobacillus jeddahense TaxID=1462527 RepID=A0ABY5JSI0_9BACI|nr:hypothetical protein [Oceanobacillus jeddahense]UUI02123.1 hypothetical protein NP439_19075 [Oceanobacillus jeddahense]
MNVKKNYGFWSMLSSIMGLILLIVSYAVAPEEPQGMVTIGILVLFFTAILFLVLGTIGSTLAMKQQEKGRKKYVGIFLPVLILLFVVLVPILMGIGFILNDNSSLK